MPASVLTKSQPITKVTNASNANAIPLVIHPGLNEANRIAAIALAASGKLTAHHDN